MTLKERLEQDMKDALKAREAGKLRLSVIRLARAAIKNAEIEKMKPLDDAGVIEVLAREVKQRRDAIPEFRRGNRPDLVAQLEQEIQVLKEYLPEQLDEQTLRQMARDAVVETGASSPRDMGKVMAVLMPRVRGRADGRLVNEIVKKLLG